MTIVVVGVQRSETVVIHIILYIEYNTITVEAVPFAFTATSFRTERSGVRL